MRAAFRSRVLRSAVAVAFSPAAQADAPPLAAAGAQRALAASRTQRPSAQGAPASAEPPVVVFVLGGPGAGKGTQCANLVRDYGFVHLSAGDLLRAHMKSGSADGQMVADMIANGQIVPSSVTVRLLLSAMAASGARKFLVDGFPRNAENRDAWEREAGFDCAFVLFFEVAEEVMERRLLGRQEGRTDDNAATIRKRFAVFAEQTQPVVAHYEQRGMVARVDGGGTPAEVYDATKPHFDKFKA